MSATSALATVPAAATDELGELGIGQLATETTTLAEPQQAEAKTSTEPATEVVSAVNSMPAPTEREQAVTRIRQSSLPPALRERLAAVVEVGQSPNLDVVACLEAIEQALPDFLRANRENVSRPAHPSGNSFFQGGDGELSDAEAEALAQQQLARSGLLRGQKVKVTD